MSHTFTPAVLPLGLRRTEIPPLASFTTDGDGSVTIRVGEASLAVAYEDVFAFIAHVVRMTRIRELERASDEKVLGVGER